MLTLLESAIAVPIAETIFVGTISSQVSSAAFPGISPAAVVKAGSTNLGSLTQNPTILQFLKQAYSHGVDNTLYLATGMIAVALIFAMGMEWRTITEPTSPSNKIATEEKSSEKYESTQSKEER